MFVVIIHVHEKAAMRNILMQSTVIVLETYTVHIPYSLEHALPVKAGISDLYMYMYIRGFYRYRLIGRFSITDVLTFRPEDTYMYM